MAAQIRTKRFSHCFIEICLKLSFPDAFYAKNVKNGMAKFLFYETTKSRFSPKQTLLGLSVLGVKKDAGNPEAVPLKKLDMETVAEALVDIFSRLRVPEEILSDVGTQFVCDCVREVTQLLSVKQLTTTPYHPMCNSLTEKFTGTMKSMLKRLCSEQPRQWHRYINPLLFAYREVPQESTGFSPFYLLYGRAVRGPMTILKQLWTKEVEECEVKNSYQYVFELQEKLEDTLKLAHSELEKAQQKGKHYYDRRSKVRKFQPD